MKAKRHNTEKPRGIRDPRKCQVQVGGVLCWVRTVPGVYDRQPEFWTDRPLKFEGHMKMLLNKPGTVIEDIKWKQLNGKCWWRIPAWPDGEAQGA